MIVYKWRGKPILDIEAWCLENNARLLRCRVTRRVPNLFNGTIETIIEEERLPELFLSNLLITDGAHYEVIDDPEPPLVGG